MNTFRWSVGTLLLGVALVTGILGIGNASTHGEDEDHEGGFEAGNGSHDGGLVKNDVYLDECGACHVAYPANLLPSNSWNRIIDTLDDHFGENAELDNATAETIRSYLADNAADANGAASKRMLRGQSGKAPLRITELPYFVRRHDEVPQRMVTGNPKVGSFSNCDACHEGAVRGVFNEDAVDIPGFGRFDD